MSVWRPKSRKLANKSLRQLWSACRTEQLEQRMLMSLSPNGGENPINNFTTGLQFQPDIAVAGDGSYVVTWVSIDQEGTGGEVFARIYNSAGVAQGAEFHVNTFTPGNQDEPAVAIDPDGNFVITWTSYGQDEATSDGIYAQRFDATGTPVGTEFKVNTFIFNNQNQPAVAMDDEGDFIIAWESDLQDGSQYGVFAQRFNSAGVTVGAEFSVNTFQPRKQDAVSVAMDSDGDFVVAWYSYKAGSGLYQIFARRYTAAGNAVGTEFKVSADAVDVRKFPGIGMDDIGNFVVAWAGFNQDGNDYGIYAKRFNSSGVAQGSEFRVNTFTTGSQQDVTVAMDAAGDFVIAWTSAGADGDSNGVFAQGYAPDGTPRGSEFQVNTVTTGNQSLPAVGIDDQGNVVVAWQSDATGLDTDIFTRRYTESVPPPSVSISTPTPAAAEASQVFGVVTFTRTGSTAAAQIVNFSWSGVGVYGDSSDFLLRETDGDIVTVNTVAKTGTITIPAGAASVSMRIVPNNDDFDESDETVIVTLNPGSGYVPVPGSGTITIADDDTQGITITPSESPFFVVEGSTNTFGVRLNARPTSDVIVTIARQSGDGGLTANKTSLTFTTNNWDDLQTVTVTDAQDGDAINGSATFAASSAGLTTQTLVTTEIDDEIAATPTPGTPDLTAASDSGASNTDNLTNLDNSTGPKALVFSVPDTVVGATVTVYADGVAIGSAVASSDVTLVTTNGSVNLNDGTRQITAKQQSSGVLLSQASAALAVRVDTAAPVGTINQASSQDDPATGTPIRFAIFFNDSVDDFTSDDVIITGTAGASTALVTGSGKNYTVAVSGLTTSGTVIINVPANAVHDLAGNSASSAFIIDNSVTFTIANLPPDGKPFTSLVGGVWTINGTNARDTITISQDDDDLVATINGNAFTVDSDDVASIQVFGYNNNDRITLGTNVQSTYVLGGDGNDTITGGGGNDSLAGASGKDVLNGRGGNDVLRGGKHGDRIFGNDGDDRMYGEDGADSMEGGNDRDRMYGGGSDDVMLGNNHNDTMYGEAGNDFIAGNGHNDRIFPGPGQDTAFGDTGNDRVTDEEDNLIDDFNGGDGDDTAIANAEDQLVEFEHTS